MIDCTNCNKFHFTQILIKNKFSQIYGKSLYDLTYEGCWETDPQERPRFIEICNIIGTNLNMLATIRPAMTGQNFSLKIIKLCSYGKSIYVFAQLSSSKNSRTNLWDIFGERSIISGKIREFSKKSLLILTRVRDQKFAGESGGVSQRNRILQRPTVAQKCGWTKETLRFPYGQQWRSF